MDPLAWSSPNRRLAGTTSRASVVVRGLVGALVAGIVLAACGSAGTPVVSFDPASPCTTDGQQPGAYPELEALLPGTWKDRQPTSLDSGRMCTTAALGTLATHGIAELRFAGSTWQIEGPSGFTFAVFEADGLDAGRVVEFYESGSRSAGVGGEFRTSDITIAGEPAIRLDVEGVDGSSQTVIAWPGPDASAGGRSRVYALLIAGMGDSQVAELLDTFGGG